MNRSLIAFAGLALGALACGRAPSGAPDGISWDLAQNRHARISDLHYTLQFAIPADRDSAIAGAETIALKIGGDPGPLVIDFTDPASKTHSVAVDGKTVRFATAHDHLILPASAVPVGAHTITIAFTAGNGSLNRNPDFLYTLFVPARAHSAFPCFDQPNLKATYTLTLAIPRAWTAVANGVLKDRADSGAQTVYHFGETKPLPTYLFAFVAGKFQVDSAVRDGRLMHMYFRETDTAKVRRNRGPIFDIAGKALAWLQDYTGIPYPFGKYDFVLIPAFQYGGMEHAGAILFNASSLMLDRTATQNRYLGRASVIAHETSHMWFGDLVTMNWFDDVWTKEVFANFMAAKIVNPTFPHIDHPLRFLLAHYPAAYAVDRSEGANAIRQPLDNLNDAGSLYGNIIYDKAPIVMEQLEGLVGDTTFRDGLREYLHKFSYGNATWPALIDILDARSPHDLKAWSHVWVEEPGRPEIHTVLTSGPKNTIGGLRFVQSDPYHRGRRWIERLNVALHYGNRARVIPVQLADSSVSVPSAEGMPRPDFILPNGKGIAYGDFVLDSASQAYLLDHLPSIKDDLTRGIAWVTLWDAVLDGRVTPARFIRLALRALPAERVDLNAEAVLGYLDDAYWHYLTPDARRATAPTVEATLWHLVRHARSRSLEAAYFNAYRSDVLTDSGVARVERIWKKTESVPGLPLAERDYTAMAQALAVRGVSGWQRILETQRDRITNPDRKAAFEFVMPALSADSAVRDSFFQSLKDRDNRRHEPWVLQGLSFLHHPLRAASSVQYIEASLALTEEIQRTGDIFFPGRWLGATLSGHTTPAAAKIVRDFLAARPNYPPRLRGKILQAADHVFRSAKIVWGQ